jgi:hypothetical protein
MLSLRSRESNPDSADAEPQLMGIALQCFWHDAKNSCLHCRESLKLARGESGASWNT